MKKFLSFFKPLHAAMLLACLSFTACGGDDGNGSGSNGSNGAPSNVKGREFVFYDGGDLDWQFRVTCGGSDGKAALMTNSDLSLVTDPYCYYRKTTGNMATMQINYSSYVNVGGVLLGRMTLLDLKLTFTSANGGIYTGTSTVTGGMGEPSTSQMSGYFSYNTTFSPTWQGDPGGGTTPGGDSDEEQGGSSSGGTVSSALGVEITSVRANDSFRQHAITFVLKKNSTSNLPATVGYIIGTSPGVTLDNALKVREESDTPLKGFAEFFGAYTTEMDLLKAATRYYVRPFHREGNKVIYYEETSFETLGGEITLDLRNNLIPVFTFAYNIKRSGQYQIGARFRVNGDFYEKVYKTISGGSGYVTIDARNDTPYDWYTEIECVWGTVTDLDTGTEYHPPYIKGPAPSTVKRR